MTDLTRQLQGKEVVAVLRNGTTLLIQCKDGAEITVQWVDDNGTPLKGRPVISSKGWRMKASGIEQLMNPDAPRGRVIVPR